MKNQASPEDLSPYADPFNISPCKSPHRYSFEPPKVQQEVVPPSPRLPHPSPASVRAYNKKDYNYIASFPRATHVGMKLDRREAEILQCQEICRDDVAMAPSMHSLKQSHAPLPKFGAWDAEASSSSVEGYTDVFDRAREQKRHGSLPAQSVPQDLQAPIPHLTKELTVAKAAPQSWSRCFVAPATVE